MAGCLECIMANYQYKSILLNLVLPVVTYKHLS